MKAHRLALAGETGTGRVSYGYPMWVISEERTGAREGSATLCLLSVSNGPNTTAAGANVSVMGSDLTCGVELRCQIPE